jgi:DNA-binding IclR family transcriptional regulator
MMYNDRGGHTQAKEEPGKVSATVKRATEIIEFIAEAPRTLNEITSHFTVDRSTIFRQLQTLERAGFLIHRSDGTYNIGIRIISIAQQALDNLELHRIAHDEIRALHQRVGNTIHLAQLVEETVVYVDKVEGTGSVRMYSRVGLPVVPHRTGVGKVILAQLPQRRRDSILRGVDWGAQASTTPTGRESLDRDLEEIRRNGWGVDDGEFEEFVNCVAAPVTNSTGSVVGALSITAIKMITDLNALKEHVPDLLATARRISRELG